MSCPPLAVTGEPVLATIGLGVAILVVGTALVVAGRRGRGRFTGAAMVVLLTAGVALAVGSDSTPAHADPSDCGAGGHSTPTAPAPGGTPFLVVAQTSTMTGLAPGVDPVDITGIVTNTGTATTFVVAVTVDITGVVPVHAGPCTASDYVLLDVVMPVGRTLDPGESTGFAGARIGFHDTAVNQDACQSAVVDLRYLASWN